MSLQSWRKFFSIGKLSAQRLTRKKKFDTDARSKRPSINLIVDMLEDRTLLSTFQWIGGGSTANWNDPTNWNLVSGAGTFPNATGDVARFNAAYGGNQSVTLNVPITVGEIDFGSSVNVSIVGPNTLTLLNTGNSILDAGQTFANTGTVTDLISAPINVSKKEFGFMGGAPGQRWLSTRQQLRWSRHAKHPFDRGQKGRRARAVHSFDGRNGSGSGV